jgi:hypothetical protein
MPRLGVGGASAPAASTLPVCAEWACAESGSGEWRAEECGEEQLSVPQRSEQQAITVHTAPEAAVARGDAAPMAASAVGCQRAERLRTHTPSRRREMRLINETGAARTVAVQLWL